MKKFDVKSIVVGLIIGSLGVTSVLAAGGIKSATYSPSKVYFYEQEIPLKNSLVTIIKDGETNAQMYMPMRELLEYMQFNVEWNSSDSSVNLTMNGDNGQNNNPQKQTISPDISQNEADKTSLDIMQRTGNWSYIEPYLKYMTNQGIDAVVNSYNSKHINKSENKKASDYYNDTTTSAKILFDDYIEFQKLMPIEKSFEITQNGTLELSIACKTGHDGKDGNIGFAIYTPDNKEVWLGSAGWLENDLKLIEVYPGTWRYAVLNGDLGGSTQAKDGYYKIKGILK